MKKVFTKEFLSGAFGFVVVALLFVAASALAGRYEDGIRALAGHDGFAGMAAYVAVTVVSVVIAPVSTLPLLPLASAMWGWVIAGALSVVGWTIGAQVAFFLARRFGVPLVRKLVSLETLNKVEDRLPREHLFWSVVFLRMAVPVDVLSYAIGLFSRMKGTSYFFATLIGVIPFAFLFAYAGTLSPVFQIAALLAGIAVFFIGIKATRGKFDTLRFNGVFVRFIVLAAFIAAVIFLIRYFGVADRINLAMLKERILGFGALAGLAYMGIYAAATVLFIPGTPLTVAGGALFGPVFGTLYTVLGATVGASLAFFVARFFGRGFIGFLEGERFKKLADYDKKIEENGIGVVLFLRFVPLFPFNGLNFALGLTKVSFRDYFWGTLFGIVPGTFAYAYFGDSLASLNPLHIAIAIALLATLAIVAGKLSKKTQTTV